jgi:hypothetical protein
MLTTEKQSADELAGAVPVSSKAASGIEQTGPLFDVEPIDNQKILEAMQSGKIPTDKRTPQRSYNIERHHQGARAAINATFDEIKSADQMASVLDVIAENTSKKESQTFDEIRASVNTPEDIFRELEPVFKDRQQGLLTSKQNYAARILASSLFESMKNTAEALNKGDDSAETLLTLAQATEQLNFIVQYVANNATETGRALGSHRLIANALKNGSLEEMSNLLNTLGGVDDIKYQAKLIGQYTKAEKAGEPSAAQKYMGYMSRKIRGVTRPALEYWRAQILTGVRTHIINLSGTAMQGLWDNMLIRPTAAALGEGRKGLNKLFGKDTPDYVGWQEVLAANASTFMSMLDSFSMMTKAFIENEGRFTGTY